jgi:hypothetical protein
MLYQNFDLLLRKLISIFYRILLVGFSITVLIRNPNIFSWYYYAGIIVIYIIVYFLLFNKDGFFAFLRLVVDFLFIFLALYKKDINNFHSMTLIFLPLINSVNHSSNTRSKFSPFALYVFTFFLLFFLREFKFVLGDIVALMSIWIANIFLYARHYLVRIFNSIDEIISEFYQEKIELGQQYKLLRSIRDVLNKNRKLFFLIHRPSHITIFSYRAGKFSVVTSTHFFTKYKFIDEANFISEISTKDRLRNVKLSFDNGQNAPNIVYKVVSDDVTYFYIVSIFQNNELFIKELVSDKIYSQIFQKITTVLQVERSIALEKKEYLYGIKKKMVFVDSTIKSIHFLNNRLTPISTYFDLLKLCETETNVAKRDQLLLLLETEKKNAMNNLDPIIGRMKAQLDKSNNPYIITSIENIGVQKLYSIIRKSWEDSSFSQDDIGIDCSPSFLAREMLLNIDSFEFLIDEILNNVIKHSSNLKKLIIKEEGDELCISFVNDIKQYNKNVDWLTKVIQYFNADDINEIIRKTSYGLTFMKDSLKQMNLSHEMRISEDKKFILLLKIKTQIKNEGSTI